jgi:hypothetical protein
MADQAAAFAKKDGESLSFEIQGLKAKLESEKKNSAFQIDLLKKQMKQIEEDAEAMNQEKGIQSRWITDQKLTLEKEVADLEDERAALLADMASLEKQLESGGNAADDLRKELNAMQAMRDDLHSECTELLRQETSIVKIEVSTKGTYLTHCPREINEYKHELEIYMSDKLKCDPDRLKVMSAPSKAEVKGNLEINVQIKPASKGPQLDKGWLGLPSRMLAKQLHDLFVNFDIRNLPGCAVEDHLRVVLRAQEKQAEIRQVHKLCAAQPGMSHKDAKKRVKLGSAPVKSPPPETVAPIVQNSAVLGGADAISILTKENERLEHELWEKKIVWETHIQNVWHKMLGRKFIALWKGAVILERKGLRIMRRVLMQCAYKCLLIWEENHKQEKHHRMVGQKMLKMWQNKSMVACYHSWLAHHKKEKENRHIMRKIVVMMHNRCLVKCFETWQYATTTEGRMERIGGAIARRWMMLSCAHCIVEWSDHAKAMARERLILKKITVRWLKSSMSHCFDLWKESVFHEMKLSDLLQLDDKIHEFQREIELRLEELQKTRASNEEAIARLNKLREAMLAEKENEIKELTHAMALSKEELGERKKVIERQQALLDEESRKHRGSDEQLFSLEAEMRKLKSENIELSGKIQTLESEYASLQNSSKANEE